ncbi:Nramp family divalent metal transporter [Paracraurococcus lichenis]|uniref:Nramp family divalent metal transporter n=1 Tax=Paracraurococcus lichenis TaxID=3064888 RepID=A0ABT9DYK5_9PROT|nr:Nramp family divalent metal transporter [Paracraurococcus sp. LOR1-02]MDO9708963.1 Nramp family divalent metal transporter [Paracraurococcus sp. LOR1-02]
MSGLTAQSGDLPVPDATAAAAEGRGLHRVPDPYPLTLAGMLAALGPQAINFGISIGGGEAYLLPNISARGTLHMHWLMLLSVVLETALVYECIKYSVCTGRSFFAATNELSPRGFWPWFWAVVAILTWAWPAWMGGAVIAAERFTGIGNPPIWGLPPHYIWAVLALALVLVVFYFSDKTYAFLEKFFLVIMVLNIALVLLITGIAAKPEHYWQVLEGYVGLTFLREGYPESLPKTDALALFNQPGGSLMWVSFWVIAAGFGMGRYAGQVTGVLKPPETITVEELHWDTSDPEERRKMQQWVKVGGYSLILWWALIGGLLMTYLYSVAGLAYLHDDFLRTGQVPSGVQVPLQMATIAQGVLGPTAGWLMLLAIMVTLYDAQFPFYDTYIGRTTCDAIAVTGRARRPYRVYYFTVVTIAVAAGLYLVTVAQPFVLWIGVAISALVYRSIGAWQILLLNNRRLPEGFGVSRLNTWLLWITVVTGFGGVALWAVFVLPGEIARRFG